MPASPSSLSIAIAGKSTPSDPGRLLDLLKLAPDPRGASPGSGISWCLCWQSRLPGSQPLSFVLRGGNGRPTRRVTSWHCSGIPGPAPSEKASRLILNAVDDALLPRVFG